MSDFSNLIEGIKMKVETLSVRNKELDIYDSIVNAGILNIEEGKTYQLKIIVNDVYGNASSVSFKINGTRKLTRKDIGDYDAFMDCLSENSFIKEDFALIFPPKTLYEDLKFHYTRKPKYVSTYSPIHIVGNLKTPVQKQYTIKINSEGIPEGKEEKALIVQLQNKTITGKGGVYDKGWITTKVKSFGTYAVMIDEKAPVIHPLDFTNQKNVSRYKNLNFTVVDDISGVESVEASINNEWIPLIYVPKRNKYIYVFDNTKVARGTIELKIKATDERGNTSEKTYKLIR